MQEPAPSEFAALPKMAEFLTFLKFPEISGNVSTGFGPAPFSFGDGDGNKGSLMVLEGGIAAGKTTTGKSLLLHRAVSLGGRHVFFEEPLDPVRLGEYIKDPKNKANGFQRHMLSVRIFLWRWAIRLVRSGIHVILDRSFYGDWVFAYVNFLFGSISAPEFEDYMKEFEHISEELSQLGEDLDVRVVYIKEDLEECLQRIRIRNRYGESGYTEEYLRLLILVYDKYDVLFEACKTQELVQPVGSNFSLSQILGKISELKSVQCATASETFWKKRTVIENPILLLPRREPSEDAGIREVTGFSYRESKEEPSYKEIFEEIIKGFGVHRGSLALDNFGTRVTVDFTCHSSLPIVKEEGLAKFSELQKQVSDCKTAALDNMMKMANHLVGLVQAP